ncbi:MAG: PAS domain S-box protein [Nitrospirae bacterium]|nr:PAS domain S-box protein [Nitrospirota bacterium]
MVNGIMETVAFDDLTKVSDLKHDNKNLLDNYVYRIEMTDDGRVNTTHGPGCEAITGYTTDEYSDTPLLWHQMIYEEDREWVSGCIDSPNRPPFEHRIIHKDGSIRWIRNSPILDPMNKGYSECTRIITDITERKKIEETLKNELQISSAIAEVSEALLSPDYDIIDISRIVHKQALRLTKSKYGFVSEIDRNTAENVGHTLSDMLGGDECKINTKITRIAFSKDICGYNTLWGHALNTKEAFYTNSAPEHPSYKGCMPEGHVPIDRYMAVPALIGDVLIGQISLANAEKDYTDEDLKVIKRLASLYAIAIDRKRKETDLLDLNKTMEQRVLQRTMELQDANSMLKQAIKERKIIEEQILKAKMFSETIINSLPGIFYLFDKNGKCLSWNRNLEDVTGYSSNEIENMKPEDCFIREDKWLVYETMQQVFSKKRGTSIEATMCTKDGKQIPYYFNGLYIELEEKKPCIIGIGLDISQRKQLESQLSELNENLEIKVQQETEKRRRQEQLLIQQAKMASLGEMISAIAHQWKQPLNAVSLILQDLTDAYDYGELDKEYLDRIVDKSLQQIMFMSRTIDDFRNFLTPSKIESEFDVRTSLMEILSMFSGMLKKENITVTLTEENAAEVYIATGYPNVFKQVILNIINNARDAILTGVKKGLFPRDYMGGITIILKRKQDKITLQIRDNGGGIPEDVIDKIFEHYFTTKSSDKGTGIGLYMSKAIIENNMKGKLTVRNIEGGAEFCIEI